MDLVKSIVLLNKQRIQNLRNSFNPLIVIIRCVPLGITARSGSFIDLVCAFGNYSSRHYVNTRVIDVDYGSLKSAKSIVS